jgi:hypothetical protein
MKMVDYYFDKHSEVLASDDDNESPRLGDPVFRRSFKEWLRNRQQRDHSLEELETVYRELETVNEGARQDASAGAKRDKRT